MTRSLRRLAALAGVLLLASCASSDRTTLYSIGKGLLDQRAADKAPKPDPAVVARNSLAQVQGPIIMVQFPQFQAVGTMIPIERNGAYVTWGGPDRRSVTTLNGVVVATRGFAWDMMAANVGDLAAQVSARKPGTVRHAQTYLSPEHKEVALSGTCRIEVGTISDSTGQPRTPVYETCSADMNSIRNEYLVDRSGKIVRATQWVSPKLGYMTITHLR